jgi:hypothetical protein
MVSLVRKLRKGVTFKLGELYEVVEVYYKEARNSILNLSLFCFRILHKRENPKHSQWLLMRFSCRLVFIDWSPHNSHQCLKGWPLFSHKSNREFQYHTKRSVIPINNSISLQWTKLGWFFSDNDLRDHTWG